MIIITIIIYCLPSSILIVSLSLSLSLLLSWLLSYLASQFLDFNHQHPYVSALSYEQQCDNNADYHSDDKYYNSIDTTNKYGFPFCPSSSVFENEMM